MSDPHFCHDNLQEKVRGDKFGTVEAMNKTIIDNINATCLSDDHLRIVGDIGIGGAGVMDCVRQINCNLSFILGNHDANNGARPKPTCLWAAHKIHGMLFLVSHFPPYATPVPPDILDHPVWDGYMCGHSHDTWPVALWNDRPVVNLCPEATGYKPINNAQIAKLAHKAVSQRHKVTNLGSNRHTGGEI